MNVTEVKIPTGRRRTSWLFTKRDRGFEPGTTEKQIIVAGRRPWTGTSGLEHQCPKPLGHAASCSSRFRVSQKGPQLTNEEVPEDTESSRLLFGFNNSEHTDGGYVSKTSIPSAVSDETQRAQIILAEKNRTFSFKPSQARRDCSFSQFGRLVLVFNCLFSLLTETKDLSCGERRKLGPDFQHKNDEEMALTL